jgi:hypothetical protein
MRSNIKSFAKKFIPKSFKNLIRNIRSNQHVLLQNIYAAKHSKRVLLSYITSPFTDKVNLAHTNTAEAVEIAKTFDKLGYIVDVVDFSNTKQIDFSPYDVVFGFGFPMENSFYSPKKMLRIHYGTGRHPLYQNQQTIKRFADFYDRYGIFIPDSARLVMHNCYFQTALSDAVITLGGEAEKKVYQQFTNKPVYYLSDTAFAVHDATGISDKRNITEAKKHFLWIGGYGLVHKGLDLLLDLFLQRNDIHLHIFGHLDQEPEFMKLYQDKLSKAQNIHPYGFVSLDSELFKNVITLCQWVLSPSCSEGSPTAVLNGCYNGGLIPIVTENSIIPNDGFVQIIPDLTSKAIEETINSAMSLQDNEIQKLTQQVITFSRKHYTIETFGKNMTEILQNILHE